MSGPSSPSTVFHPRPAPGRARPWEFPVPVRETLTEGVRVLRCHRPGRQLITVEIFLALPLHLEQAYVDGLATVLTRSLVEGVGHLDAQAFADRLERCGASFEAYADSPGIRAVLSVPARHLVGLLPLIGRALLEPALSDEGIQHVVRLRLDEIRYENASPARRAGMALYRHLFAAEDRISRPRQGTHESVGAIGPALVRDFHRHVMTRAAMTVILVGDLQQAHLDRSIREAFGDWPASADAAVLPAVTASGHGRTVLLDRPGAPQTYVMAGAIAAGRRDVSWAAQEIGIYCLGGTLTSRLNLILREQKGVSYGMRAFAQPLVNPVNGASGSLAAINGAVATDATAETLSDIRTILDDVATRGLTPEERDFAVRVATETAPIALQTSAAVATTLVQQVEQGLPDDAQARLYQELARVTTAEASAAAVRAYPGEGLVTVLVGDAARIHPAVNSLGPGEVTVVPAKPAPRRPAAPRTSTPFTIPAVHARKDNGFLPHAGVPRAAG
ncbi:insulinase family protein [Streptomyces sp. NPDC019224]|uniref:M16 family metallopeptidase n=1 Tax=Streptomyces sp. NPDC019224 TaxID=3154484 RepID=UPI00340FC461